MLLADMDSVLIYWCISSPVCVRLINIFISPILYV